MIDFWIIGKQFYVMMDRILQHTNVVVGTRKINFFLIRFASNDDVKMVLEQCCCQKVQQCVIDRNESKQ